MKAYRLISTLLVVSTMLTSNVYAYSSLDVVEWVDDRGAVERYNIVSDINGLKGVTDKNGTVIVDIVYNDIKILQNWNKFAVQKKDGKWSVIDLSGKSYLKNTYDYVDAQYCDKGYLEVGHYGSDEFNNRIGIVDKEMNLIVPVEYQSYVYSDNDGLLVGKLNENKEYDYYSINEDNTLTYEATMAGILSKNSQSNTYYIKSYKACKKYDSESKTTEQGYITTLGLADSNYNVIIKPDYENDIFSYNNDLAIVKKGSTFYEEKTTGKIGNGKYGIIDRAGNEIVECKYDNIVRYGTTYTLTLNGEKTTFTANELYSSTNDIIRVKINGVILDTETPPIIVNNYTMLPLREIVNALGAEVNWNENTKTAYIAKDNTTVSFTINSSEMFINEKSVPISTPAQIIESKTYIPLRSLSTALNCQIDWDSANKIVSITI